MAAAGAGGVLTDPGLWEPLRESFAALVELSPADRATPLADLAAVHPELHAEVVALLEAHDRAGDRFERGADTRLGTRLGPFRLVALLGEGGMGTVYEAVREEADFTQRVAVKVLQSGRDTPSARTRFDAERRLLASLAHRNIATLVDGGRSEHGVPWLAMEFVDGEPITAWCSRRDASLGERLAVFRQVASAVQHAHEHLVVHRDLKPGNILVTADGTVKLLDFGIAKLVDPSREEDSPRTATGRTPLTAPYASPEQLRGDAVSTASDIYSLGVILYELVTGRRPFDDPFADRAALVAPSRIAHPRWPRPLRRDLDAVILQALRVDPGRRYRSAQQLADDLRAIAEQRQVSARPDTLGYRLATLGRRHRIAACFGAIAVVALVGGTVAATAAAREARAERDRARQEAARTRAVTRFFQDVLASARPGASGRNVSVVEAIDAALPMLDTAFAGDPDLRAAIQNTLGVTLHEMGLSVRAAPLARAAVDTLRRLHGPRPTRELADAIYNLAGVEAAAGDPARAEALYRESLALYLRFTPGDSTDYFAGLNNLALAIHNQGRLDDAIALYLEAARHHGPGGDPAPSLINAATALTELGRYDSAATIFAAAARIVEAREGPSSQRLAALLQPMAGAALFAGRATEAESLARRAWQIWREALGEASAVTLTAPRLLVNILADAGQCARAVALADTVLGHRDALPETDPTIGTVLMFRGWCEAQRGRVASGERQVREALALRQVAFAPDHWAIGQAEAVLGDVLRRTPSRREEGVRLLRRGIGRMAQTLDAGNVRLLQAKRWLADAEAR